MGRKTGISIWQYQVVEPSGAVATAGVFSDKFVEMLKAKPEINSVGILLCGVELGLQDVAYEREKNQKRPKACARPRLVCVSDETLDHCVCVVAHFAPD